MVKDEIADLMQYQQKLEGQFEDAIARKKEPEWPTKGKDDKVDEAQMILVKAEDDLKISRELRNTVNIMGRNLKQSPLTADNLEKVQADR